MRKLLLGLLMVCLAVSLSIPVFAGTVLDDEISNTSVTQSEGNDQLDIQRRGPYKAVVLYNGVNIRSGPGTQYPSYGHMNKGDIVWIYNGYNDPWIYVLCDSPHKGQFAYIHKDYIEEIPD